MASEQLTDQQQRYVEEYLVDLDRVAAAKRANYSAKSAASAANRLMKNPNILRAITLAKKLRSARIEVTQDRVIQEIAKIAFANMHDYISVDDEGYATVDFSDLNRDKCAAIKEIVVDTLPRGTGEDRHTVLRTRFKLYDKLEALTTLAKHLGLFSMDKPQTTVVVQVERAIPPTWDVVPELEEKADPFAELPA